MMWKTHGEINPRRKPMAFRISFRMFAVYRRVLGIHERTHHHVSVDRSQLHLVCRARTAGLLITFKGFPKLPVELIVEL